MRVPVFSSLNARAREPPQDTLLSVPTMPGSMRQVSRVPDSKFQPAQLLQLSLRPKLQPQLAGVVLVKHWRPPQAFPQAPQLS